MINVKKLIKIKDIIIITIQLTKYSYPSILIFYGRTQNTKHEKTLFWNENRYFCGEHDNWI